MQVLISDINLLITEANLAINNYFDLIYIDYTDIKNKV